MGRKSLKSNCAKTTPASTPKGEAAQGVKKPVGETPKLPNKSPKTRAQKIAASTPGRAAPATPAPVSKTPAKTPVKTSAKTPAKVTIKTAVETPAKTKKVVDVAPKTPKTGKTPVAKTPKKTIPVFEPESEDEEIEVTKAVEPVVVAKKEELKEEADLDNEKKPSKKQTPKKLTPSSEQCLQDIRNQTPVALTTMKNYFAEKNEKSLFPDIDYALHMAIAYKKPALATDQLSLKISLPHSGRNINNTLICVVMPDLDQSDAAKVDFDVEKQSREWAEKIEVDHGLTSQHISKILTKREVERIAHTFKDKRALASQYDIFLVDSRVFKAVRQTFGKEFHKAHKNPILFKYSTPMSTSIANSLNTVLYPLKRYMTRSSVPVGHLGQSSSELVENIAHSLEKICEKCPGGFENIRNIELKPSNGELSLPIYRDEGSAAEIQMPYKSKYESKKLKETVDECSTLPDGLKLAIRNNGRLRVLNEKDDKSVLYPTINDEWSERDSIKPTIDPSAVLKKREKKKKQKLIKNKQIARRLEMKIEKKRSADGSVAVAAPVAKKIKTK